jgi:cytochrome P450
MSNLHLAPGAPAVRSLPDKLRMMMAYNSDVFGLVLPPFEQYGDIYQIQVDEGRQYMLRHPDHIHHFLVTDAASYHKDRDYTDPHSGLAFFLGNGLLTSDGAFWRRQRKLMQPAFHTKRIEAYADTMVAYTQRMLEGWHDGAQLDVDHAMMHLTLQIVVKTMFGTEVEEDAERIGNAVDVLQDVTSSFNLLPHWMPTPGYFRKHAALRDLDEIVYRLIAQRRAEGDDRGDLLSMLLAARDDEGEGMTDQQVRDEAVTIILAGHETTANAMNWTWTLLAQHPHIEARLHDELDTVLGGEPPTLADLRRLPYTEMVVKESMRLYPPAYAFSRVAVQDTTIGEYDVPKGTVVGVMSYAAHRDPRWWDAADQFIPERFAEEDPNRPRYAYLPFGGGPRVCIGNSFAMMEAQLLLATIAQRYRLTLPPGHVVVPDPKITLRPKGGLPMFTRQREPQPTPLHVAP